MKRIALALALVTLMPAWVQAQLGCEPLFVSAKQTDPAYNPTALRPAVLSPNEITRYFSKNLPSRVLWPQPMLEFLFPNGALIESQNQMWLAPTLSRDFVLLPLGAERVVDTPVLVGGLQIGKGTPYLKDVKITRYGLMGQERMRIEIFTKVDNAGNANKLELDFSIVTRTGERPVAVPELITLSRKPRLLVWAPDIFWTPYFSGQFVNGVREKLAVPTNDEAARGLLDMEKYQYRWDN